MGRNLSKITKADESKMEIIELSDSLMDLCDDLDCLNSKSLAADFADDEPRKKAVRGLDDLHRGLYGMLSDRQHAQLTFILQQITEQEKLDRANDQLKHQERDLIAKLKTKARGIRNELHGHK